MVIKYISEQFYFDIYFHADIIYINNLLLYKINVNLELVIYLHLLNYMVVLLSNSFYLINFHIDMNQNFIEIDNHNFLKVIIIYSQFYLIIKLNFFINHYLKFLINSCLKFNDNLYTIKLHQYT